MLANEISAKQAFTGHPNTSRTLLGAGNMAVSKAAVTYLPPAVMNLMFRGRLWVSHSKYEECWDSVGDNG